MADENLLKMAEQKFQSAAEKIAKDLIATFCKEPLTNADRIRAMSDEELADWLARTQIDNVAEALKIACIPWEQHPDLRELTAKDNLEWLKQPAEGE